MCEWQETQPTEANLYWSIQCPSRVKEQWRSNKAINVKEKHGCDSSFSVIVSIGVGMFWNNNVGGFMLDCVKCFDCSLLGHTHMHMHTRIHTQCIQFDHHKTIITHVILTVQNITHDIFHMVKLSALKWLLISNHDKYRTSIYNHTHKINPGRLREPFHLLSPKDVYSAVQAEEGSKVIPSLYLTRLIFHFTLVSVFTFKVLVLVDKKCMHINTHTQTYTHKHIHAHTQRPHTWKRWLQVLPWNCVGTDLICVSIDYWAVIRSLGKMKTNQCFNQIAARQRRPLLLAFWNAGQETLGCMVWWDRKSVV